MLHLERNIQHPLWLASAIGSGGALEQYESHACSVCNNPAVVEDLQHSNSWRRVDPLLPQMASARNRCDTERRDSEIGHWRKYEGLSRILRPSLDALTRSLRSLAYSEPG